MDNKKASLLDLVDIWFKSKCNGSWEHHHGFTLQTTDNPGWLMSIDLEIDNNHHNKLAVEIKEKYQVDFIFRTRPIEMPFIAHEPKLIEVVNFNGKRITIFSKNIEGLLLVATHILQEISLD